MTAADTLALLQRWRDAGWLRALDLALARLLHQLDPAAPGSLLAAAALLAQLEGRGHGCLPLALLHGDGLPALLAWPEAAAAELTALQPLWPADADAARATWRGTPLLVDGSGSGGDAAAPLVLDQGALYLRRYWRHERRIAARLLARCAAGTGAGIDLARARTLLDQLFGPPGDGPDWQRLACALALRGRLTIVTGGPGTGKTYTAARLLVLLQALHGGPQPLRVALAAPTGKAAARLRQSITTALQALGPLAAGVAAGPAQTLHALLGARPGTRRFVHDAAHPLDLDLLFVDEASMVHLEMMDSLLDALPPTARLVLLGDRDQLASVEAGAVLGDLCAGAGAAAYDGATRQWLQALGGSALPAAAAAPGGALAQQTATLLATRRFDGAIGTLAQALNRGDATAALALLQQPPDGTLALQLGRDAQPVLPLAVAGRPGAPGGYTPYLQALGQRPAAAQDFEPWARHLLQLFDAFRVLCAVRDGPWGVAGLNAAIERTLAAQGLLQRRGEWYEGRPVLVTRNDPALGVFNGDIGLVLRAPGGGPLRACFADGATLRTVSVARLADVETAFAMTVHKSQGSEFAHVVLVLPDADGMVLTRELVYTGVSRARRALTVVADDPRRLAAACGRLTQRLSGLRAFLP